MLATFPLHPYKRFDFNLNASFFRSKTEGLLGLDCFGHHHAAKIVRALQLRAIAAMLGLFTNSGLTHFTNLLSFSRSLVLIRLQSSHRSAKPMEVSGSTMVSPPSDMLWLLPLRATRGRSAPLDAMTLWNFSPQYLLRGKKLRQFYHVIYSSLHI